MARIRHIAIATHDPEATATFYKQGFGFEEVGRVSSDKGKFGWGVFLSDGVLNLAILKFKVAQGGIGPDFVGIHHLGFLVEDVAERRELLEKLGAVCFHERTSENTSAFFETKFVGPDGVVFDISDHPWIGNAEMR